MLFYSIWVLVIDPEPVEDKAPQAPVEKAESMHAEAQDAE